MEANKVLVRARIVVMGRMGFGCRRAHGSGLGHGGEESSPLKGLSLICHDSRKSSTERHVIEGKERGE